jgi:hypothetical protein
MDELRLPSIVERSQRVLVAGAGGGFDVYAGLPIYERLRTLGKQVFLANLSFTWLGDSDAPHLTRALYQVESTTSGPDLYFPERTLARFLSRHGENVSVYGFEKLGVAPVREGYAHLVQSLGLDAIVLVDGGTDILLRVDEAGLGTPAEDMTSLAAVAALDLPTTGRGLRRLRCGCISRRLPRQLAGECGRAGFRGCILRRRRPT